MSGLLAIIGGEDAGREDRGRLTGAINLSGKLEIDSLRRGGALFAVSYPGKAPLGGARLIEGKGWIVAFAGDLVGLEGVPGEEIVLHLERGDADYFKGLEGVFAIAAYDELRGKLFIVSDRRSQQPVYYARTGGGMAVSADLPVFCRLGGGVRFNEAWLWEYLYFNYPIGDSTFLAGVKRMPPASILEFDRGSGEVSVRGYAGRFSRRDDLIGGEEALEKASEVFSARVPVYYEGAGEVACALTGGWDGRTMLALAPEKDVTAYTYGVPGCDDLAGGADTARLAGIKHMPILFDERFTRELPRRMMETVYLSSGLQGVLRATLLYAYGTLTEDGARFPLTISGISMDMQFRGHACAPALISQDVVNLFEGRETAVREEYWTSVLGPRYRSFKNHILMKLGSLRDDFGDFDSTGHHLSYILYVLSTCYFCGELKIADHFTTVRVPCWDSAIIDLSYSIEQSTLSFSQFTSHERGDIAELVLQSYLLAGLAPRFAKAPIGNTRPDIILKGGAAYDLYRIYRAVTGRIADAVAGRRRNIPLEDWEGWLNGMHRAFIDGLVFSAEARIRGYMENACLQRLAAKRDIHLIGKLATAEVLIRLVENGWQRFW